MSTNFPMREQPKQCDECGSERIQYVKLGKQRLWPFVWQCDDCKASVGCHRGTNNPLGKMANSTVRRLRSSVHFHLDRIWKSGYVKRNVIYDWLAMQLGIEGTCHISELSLDELKRTINILDLFLTEHGQRIKKKEQSHDKARRKESDDHPADRRRMRSMGRSNY